MELYINLHGTMQWELCHCNCYISIYFCICTHDYFCYYFFVSVIRKYHSEWLKQQEFIFSQFWKLGSTRSRDQPVQFLVRALFWVCTWLSSHESSHGREREQASALSVSSYKGTNPIMRYPPSWSHLTLTTSQRPCLHTPPYWRLCLQHMNWGWRGGGETQAFSP